MTEASLPAAGGRRAPAGGWRTAEVRSAAHVASGVVLRLAVPDRVDHLPGQHYVIRLRAEDGYTAQRSYSVASAPTDPELEFYIEHLPDGEVSGYLAEVVRAGDELEIRGPIGGWFVWDSETPGVGIAGGSGVVPLVSMLRTGLAIGRPQLLKFAVAARTRAQLPYADELFAAGATLALSRQDVGGRSAGRLSAADVEPLLTPGADYFVCGSTGFAESASTVLVGLGVPAERIRVERFGPSGL